LRQGLPAILASVTPDLVNWQCILQILQPTLGPTWTIASLASNALKNASNNSRHRFLASFMLESSISSPRVPGYSYSSHPQNLLVTRVVKLLTCKHHCYHIYIYSLLTSRRPVVRHASSVPPLLILPGANESASAFQELWKILGNRSQVGP
jgi:hypothetical protein